MALAQADDRKHRPVSSWLSTVTYFEELCRAMTLLGTHERSIFIGQAVEYPGTGITKSLAGVPKEKLKEVPVFEDDQLGMAIGLSLAGRLPICIYPRINFLLLAMSQLILHLDCLPEYSDWKPHVIIRTAVATSEPLDPGPQHLGDFTQGIWMLLEGARMVRKNRKGNVKVVKLETAGMIVPEYQEAVLREGSTLIVEQIALYDHVDTNHQRSKARAYYGAKQMMREAK